jgi:hypothetical protein
MTVIVDASLVMEETGGILGSVGAGVGLEHITVLALRTIP